MFYGDIKIGIPFSSKLGIGFFLARFCTEGKMCVYYDVRRKLRQKLCVLGEWFKIKIDKLNTHTHTVIYIGL